MSGSKYSCFTIIIIHDCISWNLINGKVVNSWNFDFWDGETPDFPTATPQRPAHTAQRCLTAWMWNSFCGIKRTKASLLWTICFWLTVSARDFCWKPEIQPQKRCKKSKSQTKKQKVRYTLSVFHWCVHRNAHTQESRTRTGHFSNVSVRQSHLKSTRLCSTPEICRLKPIGVSAVWSPPPLRYVSKCSGARSEAPSCTWALFSVKLLLLHLPGWGQETPMKFHTELQCQSFFWRSRSSCFSVITAIIIIMVPEPEPHYT